MGVSRTARQLLATRVEAERDRILAAYQRNLEAHGSPLVQNALAMRQVLGHAEAIITDLVTSLRTGQAHMDEEYRIAAWEIGATRAAQGIHPTESLQATGLLFETVLRQLAESVTGEDNALELLTLAMSVLNQNVTTRIMEAADMYFGHLLNRIHESQLEERHLIARELHDRIGHGVSTAYRQLELYEVDRERAPFKAESRIGTAQELIRETMQDLRSLTAGLRIQDSMESIEKSLLHYLETERTDEVTTRLQVNGDETWAPADVRAEIFLILREALRNAFTHAAATLVLVRVDIAPHELRASVEDNGQGFQKDADTYRSDGMGQVAMLERTQLLGGTLSITSTPGQGTRVRLAVPLAEGR